jgi:DNA-damage-inducible protein J
MPRTKTKRDFIVRARVDAQRAKKVHKILAGLGITVSEAINMFYAAIIRHNGIPFLLKAGPLSEKEKRAEEDSLLS